MIRCACEEVVCCWADAIQKYHLPSLPFLICFIYLADFLCKWMFSSFSAHLALWKQRNPWPTGNRCAPQNKRSRAVGLCMWVCLFHQPAFIKVAYFCVGHNMTCVMFSKPGCMCDHWKTKYCIHLSNHDHWCPQQCCDLMNTSSEEIKEMCGSHWRVKLKPSNT